MWIFFLQNPGEGSYGGGGRGGRWEEIGLFWKYKKPKLDIVWIEISPTHYLLNKPTTYVGLIFLLEC